jgi:aspartate/glutamate racemase
VSHEIIAGISTMAEKHYMAKVNIVFRARNDNIHPLHSSVNATKVKRINRYSSWMTNAETTTQTLCDLDKIIKGREWVESVVE